MTYKQTMFFMEHRRELITKGVLSECRQLTQGFKDTEVLDFLLISVKLFLGYGV